MENDKPDWPRIIIHDVCQCVNFSRSQRRRKVNAGTVEKLFFDNMLQYTDVPMEMSVLAAGIERYPDWVRLIKDTPLWKVSCHGLTHIRYDRLDEKECEYQLSKAKDMIESAFERHVDTFIPPFNKYNDTTYSVAKRLGMEEHRQYRKMSSYVDNISKCTQLDLHYWDAKNNRSLAHIIRNRRMKQPIIIVGAPRSGTTALMRHLSYQMRDYLPLKEHEQFWEGYENSSAHRLKIYYAKQLVQHDKMGIIDKNVRNSMRITKIHSVFPEARFIHIIRDGRAAIFSWYNWCRTRRKEPITMQESAKQWVEYVTYIRNNSSKINNYEEVRYEDLCREHDYFSSRNNKWKKNITKEQLDTIMQTAGPLLKELNYV